MSSRDGLGMRSADVLVCLLISQQTTSSVRADICTSRVRMSPYGLTYYRDDTERGRSCGDILGGDVYNIISIVFTRIYLCLIV